MKVAVVCFGAMRSYLPAPGAGNRGEVEIPEGSRVEDLVDVLGAPRNLVFALLIDGRQGKLEDPLHEGAEVTLMPPFAGGAPKAPLRRSRRPGTTLHSQCRPGG